MAKGERKTIILNPANPKEKLILDLLSEQYNTSEFIKNILYRYATNNLHVDNTIINELSHNDNSDFLIDVNKVSDKDANISDSEIEDPNKNALDFLKNSF
ncbi:MAG: hypothetical protein DBY38_01580 [Clostridium cadaveris]|uniref:Uncharacterized protein n=1 Tax=Clostridium cadaveris TaxID=1529 RepID=A0A316MAD2_9CLOT|nr:hypothetical protein [Clostridium sp.]PWL55437.1 MAG: hypothetical protein DBY38_01580 [Clostridium cadaveris]